jgi:hypothetical protein
VAVCVVGFGWLVELVKGVFSFSFFLFGAGETVFLYSLSFLWFFFLLFPLSPLLLFFT